MFVHDTETKYVLSGDADPLCSRARRPPAGHAINLKIDSRVWHRQTKYVILLEDSRPNGLTLNNIYWRSEDQNFCLAMQTLSRGPILNLDKMSHQNTVYLRYL